MRVRKLLPVVAMVAIVPFTAQANPSTEKNTEAIQVSQAISTQSAMSKLEELRARVNPGYYNSLSGFVCHSTEGGKES